MVIVVFNAHCPGFGINWYVTLLAVVETKFHTPIIPLVDVVGILIVAP
jgi:hypothetical protein